MSRMIYIALSTALIAIGGCGREKYETIPTSRELVMIVVPYGDDFVFHDGHFVRANYIGNAVSQSADIRNATFSDRCVGFVRRAHLTSTWNQKDSLFLDIQSIDDIQPPLVEDINLARNNSPLPQLSTELIC